MSKSINPFSSCKFSLKRAKQLVETFHEERIKYVESVPIIQHRQYDLATGQTIFVAKLEKPVPEELSGLAFDAINNLRAALDQSVFPFSNGRDGAFPFAKDEEHFKNALKGRTKGMPDEIVGIISDAKPYKGGNDLLYALNKIDNSRKHAIISPFAFFNPMTNLSGQGFGRFRFPKNPTWNRETGEMELFRVTPGSHFSFRFDFRSYVVMTGVDVIDGRPSSATLTEFVDIVEGIITSIETATFEHKLLS